MLSRFLPKGFDSKEPVAIIAGKGKYPVLVYERLKACHIPIRLIGFEGETANSLLEKVNEENREMVKVGQLGHLLKALKKLGAGSAIMAGQITPKRLFRGLALDWKATMVLARLKKRNAESIFGAIAEEIEKKGIAMLDARAFLDDQLAEERTMVGKLKVAKHYVDHGIEVAQKMAQLDIGQGIVARKGTILAVEAYEGTDAMLKRAGEFEASDSFFIKTAKVNQDYRFDLPVFGLNTVEVMAKAGILVAGLEAEKTIILEKDKVLEEARKQGITIFGYRVS
ncbi:MAG: DUF1009 domain-containing protein [Verrucomicrobia bacterium]|nr:MAG: DUF1009 domain-containing protein [Verrucomicrobiota bacterium]